MARREKLLPNSQPQRTGGSFRAVPAPFPCGHGGRAQVCVGGCRLSFVFVPRRRLARFARLPPAGEGAGPSLQSHIVSTKIPLLLWFFVSSAMCCKEYGLNRTAVSLPGFSPPASETGRFGDVRANCPRRSDPAQARSHPRPAVYFFVFAPQSDSDGLFLLPLLRYSPRSPRLTARHAGHNPGAFARLV